jgi:hypothetical protein
MGRLGLDPLSTVTNFVIGLLMAVILTTLLAFVVMRQARSNVCKQMTIKEEDNDKEARRRRREIEEGTIEMVDSKMKKIGGTRVSLFLLLALISTTAVEARGTAT